MATKLSDGILLSIIYLVCVIVKNSTANFVLMKTPNEFENNVFQSEYLWLISVESTTQEAEQLEQVFRGLFKIGHIQKAILQEVFSTNKIQHQTNSKFIVFPYGSKSTKISKYKHFTNVQDALTTITNTIPDITVKLPSDVDETNSHLRGFLQQLFMTRPVKFPVIYFTDQDEPPIEIRALAHKYSNLFQFGFISKPTKKALKGYGIPKLPFFCGYLIENIMEQPRLKNFQYQGRLDGPLEYPFLVNFIYLLHKRHYHELPKPDDGRSTYEVDLEDVFEEDLELFSELYKMFPMEQVKTEL